MDLQKIEIKFLGYFWENLNMAETRILLSCEDPNFTSNFEEVNSTPKSYVQKYNSFLIIIF